MSAFRSQAFGSPPAAEVLQTLAQQRKLFPASVLRIAGRRDPDLGTPLALDPLAMQPRIHSQVERLIPLQALALYALFLGAAGTALRLTSGSALGLLLGPIVAQAAMALVILMGSRLVLVGDRMPRRLVVQRRLRVAPLVLIALGGFLFQGTVLAGANLLTTAEVAGGVRHSDVPLAWTILLLTSVMGAPLLEEIFFRGMLQPLLSRRNVAIGLLLTAGLFGAAHGFATPFRAIPAFLQGLVLGALMLLTGRLLAAMVVHALNNALVLAATVLLAFRPEGLLGNAGAVPAWTVPAYAAVALMLIGWGFYRIAHEPRIATSAPAEALSKT